MTPPADLAALVAELRALEAKASYGPWFHTEGTVATKEGVMAGYPPKPECICRGNDGEYIENHNAWEDSALIAAMRNALPQLVDAAERASKAEEALARLVRTTSSRNIDGGHGPAFLAFESALADARKLVDAEQALAATAGEAGR